MKQPYVFISYSSIDAEYVDRLADFLSGQGIQYWRAPQMIPAGSNYAREIPDAIKNCEVFLIVFSKNSQSSIWVEKEIDSAVRYRRNILPVCIDGEPLNDMFRFYLNNVQMIPRQQENKAFLEIQKRIEPLVKSKAVKEPVGEPIEESIEEPVILETNPKTIRINDSDGDDFDRIREYLERRGAASAYEINRATGVSIKSINRYFADEYLEIPKAAGVFIHCEKCGAPIRTGRLCDKCKRGPLPKKQESKGGQWHSDKWKR